MNESKELKLNSRFGLDDVSVERKADLLPVELQDGFRWLLIFAREECNKDAAVLTERFKAVGVFRDRSTWSRILRGMLLHDDKQRARATPLVSLERLAEDIKALREGVRVESMRGKVPFVMTSIAEDIFAYIKAKWMPDRVNKLGVVIGPTGSQKTAVFKEFMRQHNHGLTVWLEAPENGSIKEFCCALSRKLGGPQKEPYDAAKRRIWATMNEKKLIIVDNCQRLFKERHGTDQAVFSMLQRLNDETGCTVILSVTPVFEKTITSGMMEGYFEQFEGRAGGRKKFLRLPDYPPEDDVVMIAKAFGLKQPGTHRKELVRISREPGRIRTLFDDLQDAKILAEAEEENLTIEHVRRVRADAGVESND